MVLKQKLLVPTVVESIYKQYKTTNFKPELFPANIEEFLEQHLTSIRGTSLIYSSKNMSSNKVMNEEDIENMRSKPIENV